MQEFAATWGEVVERPEGRLGCSQLHDFATRLGQLPFGTQSLRIDWSSVTHLHFRGVVELAGQLRRLREDGVDVRCSGLSPYLLAILSYALAPEEVELFAGFTGIGRGFSRGGERRGSALSLPSRRPG